MDLRELLLVALRWSHATAAVALVGGSSFCLLVLGPALRREGAAVDEVRKAVAVGFKELVDLSLVVFVVSGGLLTFERLSSGAATTTYVIVLAVKLFLSVLLYRWAVPLRRGADWSGSGARIFVVSGYLIVFLAVVLKSLYEGSLRS